MQENDNVEVIETSEFNQLDIEEVVPEITEEVKELTDEEKHEIFIQQLKDSKKTYHPKKDFGVAYKKERKRKNKQAKQSRKANRK